MPLAIGTELQLGDSKGRSPVAKLLVIGASRGIGLETVKAALRAGQSVRALPRSAASIPIQDAGRATVARIMANHSRVVVLEACIR
jgi:NAD(P)-dependent dehydrogenase (short-subunit alcohol dehydrogenase family)